MARYLVTGGAGFIGSHLVEALARAGHVVRVLDDFSTGNPGNLAGIRGTVEVHPGDVRDVDRIAEAAAGVDGVFHLAARNSVPRSFEDPEATFATNVGGTEAVVVAARAAGIRRIVLASSSSVYGDSGTAVRRESDPAVPLSPYGESKLLAEAVCLSAGAEGGPEAVCLRYFNVYGPRQDPASPYAAVIPRFITRVLRGEPVQVHGDGEQTRDFTYVADVVAGTVAAMTSPRAAGRVINLAAGGRVSVNRLAALVAEVVGGALRVEPAPPRRGEVRHSGADVTLARELLGYVPRWGLRDGLRATVAWHRERLGVTAG